MVRVVLTAFVAQLLQVQLVKLIGGLVILWVAMKLFSPGHSDHGTLRAATSVAEAVKIIVVADISMGVDNMLAVGGASQGHLGLLLFGLGLSIPFLLFASDFLSRLDGPLPGHRLRRRRDPRPRRRQHDHDGSDDGRHGSRRPQWPVYAVEAVLAAGIVAAGLFAAARRRTPSARPSRSHAHEEVARPGTHRLELPPRSNRTGQLYPAHARPVHSRPRIGSTERVQGVVA